MKHATRVLAAVFLASALVSCGGSKSTTVSITLTPATASVATGQTVQFAATVSGSTNQSVTWEVAGVAGGESTDGFISTDGIYTAPSTVPSKNPVTITAVAQADTTKTATATVTVTQASFISVSPSSITLPAGGLQVFTATIGGNAASVNWTVNCPNQPAGACGTIDANGNYTAPLSPPATGTLTIAATPTSSTSGTFAASASVTVQFSNASLTGPYTFSLAGQHSGEFVSAGSITFDGKGNITSGSEDVNSASPVSAGAVSAGTYSVGTDGRATITFTTPAGTETWRASLVNHSRAFVQRADAGSNASGTMDLQDPTKFGVSALKGEYSFSLTRNNLGSFAATGGIVGALTTDGAGNITAGLLDSNASGAITTNTALTASTFTAPSAASGRGTVTLATASGTRTFVYYIVDQTRLKLLESDSGQTFIGVMVQQSGTAATTAGLSGVYAFVSAGANSAGALGIGGTFTLDGSGTLAGASVDSNSNGTAASNTATGAYNVSDPTTGRTSISITIGGTTSQFVAYPNASGSLYLLEVDATSVVTGVVMKQSGLSPTSTVLSGNFAALFSGFDLKISPGPETITGELVLNGTSSFTGTLDVNDNGTAPTAVPLTLGQYSVSSSNGRGTASLKTANTSLPTATFALYAVSPNATLLLETDANRILTGRIEKQF